MWQEHFILFSPSLVCVVITQLRPENVTSTTVNQYALNVTLFVSTGCQQHAHSITWENAFVCVITSSLFAMGNAIPDKDVGSCYTPAVSFLILEYINNYYFNRFQNPLMNEGS